jgi:hypothetical protein
MKRFMFVAALVVAALSMSAVTATTALASNNNPPQCGGGKMIVNVTYGLYNDADSGFFGNWATDSLNRHLQIFDVGGGSFCALVNDTGSFVTTGPLSPENGVALSPGITGVINGGYVTSHFTGTFDPSGSGLYATHGNLGSFDATLAHPSFLSYFSTNGAWTQPSWGWTYHTAQNGDWVNALTSSFGDITGS